MLDRQDIDALLMGALYGELSPAESTRLDEHLSAHPQDRMVLDGLSRARQALKDSLVLTLQAEPPAAVSALLLQEAARRAPAPRAQRAGFIAKLVAFMRHPAFAAAAVIVLVAAIGGTLYKQNGDRSVAVQDVSVETPSPARGEPPAAPAVVPELAFQDQHAADQAAGETGEATNGDGYTADLDGKLDVGETKPKAPGASERGDGDKTEAEKTKKKTRDYVEVRTPDRTPKELEGNTQDKEVAQSKGDFAKDPVAKDPGDEKTRGKGTTAKTTATVIVPNDSPNANTGLSMGGDLGKSGGKSAGAGSGAPQAGRTVAQPEPPPTVAGTVAETDDATGSKNEQQDKDSYAAARSQHTKLVALVKANKCADASKLAVQIADKYLDYYKQYIANDRRVKACKPYIENARKKSADKAKRQRSDSQDASESPAPDSMKITD